MRFKPVPSLLICAALSLQACDETRVEGPAPADSASANGSGYAGLEGTVINYAYDDFSGFDLIWEDGDIRWEGSEGAYYDGVVRQRPAQVSRVADGIYFSSWPGTGGGGDNVVHDFNTMQVSAHLGTRDFGVILIAGDIHCWDRPDCVIPSTELTSDKDTQPAIEANTRRFNLPSRADLRRPDRPLLPRDVAAREELAGKTIVFEQSTGMTRIAVDGDVTHVFDNGVQAEPQQTYATRIADGIYFLSWAGPAGGNHMLFNTITRKVYDHLQPDLIRGEQIYDISCFDAFAACKTAD